MASPRDSVVLSAVLVAVLAAPVKAQDVEYTTTSKVELAGALGTIARLFGAGDESVEKTYLKGARMRTDGEESSTIMDLEAGRLIEIDHKAKSYTIMTFAQMLEAAQQISSQAQAEANREAVSRDEPEGEVDLTYSLRIETPGERQKINGYDAERIFMTLETEATVTSEGESEQAGRLVLLMDMWNAKDVPIADAMRTYYEKAPESMRQSAEEMQGTAAAFASKPEMKKALEEAAKETEKLEGFTMRSTTYMVLLPQGVELDRQALLAEKPAESGGGVRRGLGGLLRGAAGIGGSQQQEQRSEEARPTQVSLAKVITEAKDIRTTSLSADLFEPPAGYTEKPFAMPAARN